MNLMIVESAGKIKTLQKILGNNWNIIATAGHIRELDEKINNGFGFDFDNFNLHWDFIKAQNGFKSKKDTVKHINDVGNWSQKIYIAGDPDREGEAISWHIYETLTNENKSKAVRITFNELTKEDVNKAINNPRALDFNLIHAQFGRVVFDKLFGYKASDLVRKMVPNGKSAGRVQSMALRFIEEREQEIENYVEKHWYTLEPVLKGNFKTVYKKNNDGKLEIVKFDNPNDANAILQQLNQFYQVKNISNPYTTFKAAPLPLITSQLLKQSNKLNLKVKEMTNIMQGLYEKGLTTYPRTDSIRMRPEFCATVKNYIVQHFGANYYDPNLVFNTKKQKDSVQDGHDAIRVVDINLNQATKIATFEEIHPKALAVYQLIKNVTIAACMKPATYTNTDAVFDNNGYSFYGKSKVLTFDGFLKVYHDNDEPIDEIINDKIDFKVNDLVECIKPNEIITKHTTSKPNRYTQPSLIELLEKKEIGRPSTYATMVSINIDRQNVVLEKDYLVPNQVGRNVAHFIIDKLDDVVNEHYTKTMESELDLISQGKKDWKEDFIKPFYLKLIANLTKILNNNANGSNQPVKQGAVMQTNLICPKCSGSVIEKTITKKDGTTTKLRQCSNYLWDKTTQTASGCNYQLWANSNGQFIDNNQYLEETCPKCEQKGNLSKLILKTYPSGKKQKCCELYKYDSNLKKVVGKCDYNEWVNS